MKGRLNTLRTFVLHDLEVMGRQDEGVNYAAVLVILSACEALGALRYGRDNAGATFFQEYLLPAQWKAVAQDLWNALRNGLAHSYDTKSVLQLGVPIELAISWRERDHLTYDLTTNQLFLNVQEMIRALGDAFDRYEQELRDDTKLGSDFNLNVRRPVEVHVPLSRRQVWRDVLKPFGFAG